MKKVFIFGYYGFKNLGDEAILTAIIKSINEYNSSIKIDVLSYNVKYTEKIHEVKGISRNHLTEIIKAIKSSDLVISGGGSLLQDVTSSRSLFYYLFIIGIAKLLKKKVIFLCNGFGPIKNKFNQIITRTIINRVDVITVRDEGSKKAMENIGIIRPIEVTTDATFAINCINEEAADKILKDEQIPMDKPLVGISVRHWFVDSSFNEVMAKFADYLVEKGINVLFIPMQIPKDQEISRDIIMSMKKDAYILDKEYQPVEMLSVVGKMDAIVGMRLHALIFSSIMCVPMLGLEYDPKINSFLNTVGQKSLGNVSSLDYVNMCIEFDKFWTDKESYTDKLSDAVKVLKHNVLRNTDIIRKVLK